VIRVLLVEDDLDLARGLRFNLEHDGYAVTAVGEGKDALARAAEADLVILDLGLPDLDGTEVLRRLRAAHPLIPVICLTARATEADVVMGLGLGADDYIAKPFGLSELLARVAAVLRRARPPETRGGGGASAHDTLALPPVTVDFQARTAVWEDRTEELTPIEVDILRHFARHRGRALERAAILKDLWGLDRHVPTRTLDNHIARLRRKIEADPAVPRWLVTVHGIGYRLEDTPLVQLRD
jgi:DNA-binding response OmpR family regulator